MEKSVFIHVQAIAATSSKTDHANNYLKQNTLNMVP